MSGGLSYVIIDEIIWCEHTIVTPIRKIFLSSSKQKNVIAEYNERPLFARNEKFFSDFHEETDTPFFQNLNQREEYLTI